MGFFKPCSAGPLFSSRSHIPFKMKAVVLTLAVLFLTGRCPQPREPTTRGGFSLNPYGPPSWAQEARITPFHPLSPAKHFCLDPSPELV